MFTFLAVPVNLRESHEYVTSTKFVNISGTYNEKTNEQN